MQLIAFLGALLLAQATTPARPPLTGHIVVVPFSDVSALSGKMPSPTEYLIQHLRALHVNAGRSNQTDPVVAAAEAADICAQETADGLVIGRLTLSRTDKFQFPIGVVNYFFKDSSTGAKNVAGAATGLITFSGILQRTAIQAELHLYYIDCTGKVRWKTREVVGEMHHGTNIGSGYTEIVEHAIDEATADLARSQAGGS